MLISHIKCALFANPLNYFYSLEYGPPYSDLSNNSLKYESEANDRAKEKFIRQHNTFFERYWANHAAK